MSGSDPHERWCADRHCAHCYCFGRRILASWPITVDLETEESVRHHDRVVTFKRVDAVQIATGVLVERDAEAA